MDKLSKECIPIFLFTKLDVLVSKAMIPQARSKLSGPKAKVKNIKATKEKVSD
jgi:hypothetical protein